MKTSPPTSFGLKGSGCNTPLNILRTTGAALWVVVALVVGLFLNQPQARADGAHFWGHSGGPWSGGPAFSTGGRSSHSVGYSARPRTSIGISFYQGFGPRAGDLRQRDHVAEAAQEPAQVGRGDRRPGLVLGEVGAQDGHPLRLPTRQPPLLPGRPPTGGGGLPDRHLGVCGR